MLNFLHSAEVKKAKDTEVDESTETLTWYYIIERKEEREIILVDHID